MNEGPNKHNPIIVSYVSTSDTPCKWDYMDYLRKAEQAQKEHEWSVNPEKFMRRRVKKWGWQNGKKYLRSLMAQYR